MATDKAFYCNGVQLAPMNLSSTVLTNGVYRVLRQIDNGSVPRNTWEDERPTLDGKRRRGSVWNHRDMVWEIMSTVNTGTVSVANLERVRDDELEALSDLLLPDDDDLLTFKVTRQSYPSTAVSRVIYGEISDLPSWKWQPTSLDEGFVGRYDGPILILRLPIHCPFPWWADETATQTAALTLDGTLRTVTINNPGNRPCGLKFKILGSGTGLTVAVINETTGVPGTLAGSGITLTDIDLHATNAHVVDQYVDDPQLFQAYRSADGASIMANVASLPRVWLAKGDNTISYQSVTGSVGTDTIQFFHRAWWNAS